MFPYNSKRKYNIIRTSYLVQVKEFFKNSTLHGVRYIADDRIPFVDKFLWWACTSVGATVTLIVIVSLWEKFQTNPTITGLDTNFHEWDVPFPAISLCQADPINSVYLDDYIKRSHPQISNDTFDELRKFYASFGILDINYLELYSLLIIPTELEENPESFKDMYSIAKQIVNKCEDVFSDCKLKGEDADCCKIFYPIFSEAGFCFSFNVHPSQGVYEHNGQEKVGGFEETFIYETDDSWSIVVNALVSRENNIRVYLHTSREQPSLEIFSHTLWDGSIERISFSEKMTYTVKDAEQLSIKQRHCIFPDEVTLITGDVYTYSGCMMECRIKLSHELCSCTPFFYKTTDAFQSCDYNGIKCVKSHIGEIQQALCNCELPCDNTVYEVEKILERQSPDRPNKGPDLKKSLKISFLSWPIVRYKREVLFGWVDLLVSFGGIAGLFLGFSLLSGVEIIYYFTIRALCMAHRDKAILEKIAKENENREKPPLDLSFTPYFMREKEETPITPTQLYYIRPI